MSSTHRTQRSHPSGVQLPLFLRERRRIERGSEATVSRRTGTDVFTAEQLEEELWKTAKALTETQKQIARGEESYYDDCPQNNIYKGWDAPAIIDHPAPSLGAQARRMPTDCRWFSGSCTRIDRFLQPMPLENRLQSIVPGSKPQSDVPRKRLAEATTEKPRKQAKTTDSRRSKRKRK